MSAYAAIISRLFFNGYKPSRKEIAFSREEIVSVAAELGVALPKNLGDVMYSYRYRKTLPDDVIATQPNGLSLIHI